MTSRSTPQTQKEFIDYRFTETNDNIAEVKKTLDAVQRKLDSTYATKDYVDGKYKDHEERLADLEDDRKWLVRLTVGFIIMGVLYAVVRFKP